MEEVKVRATREQIEKFKKSFLWKDMIEELLQWDRGFNRERDSMVTEAIEKNLSNASVLLHLGSLDGRKMAIEFMLSLPDIFLNILEDKVNDSRRKPTE